MSQLSAMSRPTSLGDTIGIIAGNGNFPLLFAKKAREHSRQVIAVCHQGETDPQLEQEVHRAVWIKVGQLGKLITTFAEAGVKQVAMVGGIQRVRLFGGVKLDLRGAALLARLRSTKDDVIMRGIAQELQGEGIEVISSVTFMEDYLVPVGVLTKTKPTAEEEQDIAIGVQVLTSLSQHDVGQLVVVKEGVVVAVEAVEGTDAAIRRGGELGGAGVTVVKFSKTTQDLRFDVPTIGKKTIETMIAVKARVLAVEAGKCLLLDREEVLSLANSHKICLVGCAP